MSSERPNPTEGRRFYPERPGANIDNSIAILSRPPESSPTEEEKRTALMIDEALTKGVDLYSTLLNDESPDRPRVRGVEKIYLEDKVNTLDFFVEYFTTSKEGVAVLVSLGFEQKDDEVHDEEVIEFISGFDCASVDANAIAEVAGDSQKFIEKTVADQLESNNFKSLDGLTNPTKLTIIKNPENLATRLEELRALKDFIRKYSRRDSVISSPQQTVVVNMHRRRVNELIAHSYPDAIALVKQHEASPTEKSKDAIEKIAKATNAISFESHDVGSFALSRLDKYLNGAGEKGKDGEYSPISAAALRLVADLIKDRERKEDRKGKYAEYKDLFGKAKVNAEELQVWMKKVLGEYDLLSKVPESEYSTDRAGATSDNKWQVVIHPTSQSLSISGEQKVAKIQKSFNRTLTQVSPAGAVPVNDHEIEHIVQWENKRRIGLALTETVGIDRSGVYSEAGGVMWETDTQSELFGQHRGTNIDYIKAAQEKLKGNDYLDCVKAFFESNMVADPNKDKRKAAELAANRTLRLFRNEGDLSDSSNFLANSQPLVYLEQDLVVKKLKEKGMEKLLHFGINLDVLSDLHRVGLVDVNKIWVPEKKPSEILAPEIKAKFEHAKLAS